MKFLTVTVFFILFSFVFGPSQLLAQYQTVYGINSRKIGYINSKGDLVIPCQFEKGNVFENGFANVQQGDKYGVINNSGKLVIPYILDNYVSFTNGFAVAYIEGVRHYIDTTGKKTFTNLIGESNLVYSEGLAVVRKQGKYGYVNKKRVLVIPYQFSDAASFSEGLARVQIKGKFGYINKLGKIVIPCTLDTSAGICWEFKNGLACILKNNSYGYINTKGKLVIPCQYSRAYTFSEGLAVVRIDDKYGYINANGVQVIPCLYEDAHDFKESVAGVKLNGQFIFINKEGIRINDNQYLNVYSYCNGVALVQSISGAYIYIDKKGSYVSSWQINDQAVSQDDDASASWNYSMKKKDSYGDIDTYKVEFTKNNQFVSSIFMDVYHGSRVLITINPGTRGLYGSNDGEGSPDYDETIDEAMERLMKKYLSAKYSARNFRF